MTFLHVMLRLYLLLHVGCNYTYATNGKFNCVSHLQLDFSCKFMGLSTTVLGEISEKKIKPVQFVVIFYLLMEDRPMTNYESLKDLVYFFK